MHECRHLGLILACFPITTLYIPWAIGKSGQNEISPTFNCFSTTVFLAMPLAPNAPSNGQEFMHMATISSLLSTLVSLNPRNGPSINLLCGGGERTNGSLAYLIIYVQTRHLYKVPIYIFSPQEFWVGGKAKRQVLPFKAHCCCVHSHCTSVPRSPPWSYPPQSPFQHPPPPRAPISQDTLHKQLGVNNLNSTFLASWVISWNTVLSHLKKTPTTHWHPTREKETAVQPSKALTPEKQQVMAPEDKAKV